MGDAEVRVRREVMVRRMVMVGVGVGGVHFVRWVDGVNENGLLEGWYC